MVNFVAFGSGMCPSSQSPTNKLEDKNLQPLKNAFTVAWLAIFWKR